MQQPKIIGLTGPAGSGKDTVAGILLDRFGFIEESFAAPVRSFVAALARLPQPIPRESKEAPSYLLCNRTSRYAMQTLGTEWGREMLGDDIWIRQMEERMSDFETTSLSAGGGGREIRYVISDIRFENEAAWIRARGDLWHLTRPGTAVNAHISEAGIAITDRDFVLDNDCDLDELACRIGDRIGR